MGWVTLHNRTDLHSNEEDGISLGLWHIKRISSDCLLVVLAANLLIPPFHILFKGCSSIKEKIEVSNFD